MPDPPKAQNTKLHNKKREILNGIKQLLKLDLLTCQLTNGPLVASKALEDLRVEGHWLLVVEALELLSKWGTEDDVTFFLLLRISKRSLTITFALPYDQEEFGTVGAAVSKESTFVP